MVLGQNLLFWTIYWIYKNIVSTIYLVLQEAQAYAEENSLLFMETSAKTAMNVNDIFLAIGIIHLLWVFYFLRFVCLANSILNLNFIFVKRCDIYRIFC